jgi:succinylglutamate desuccinylase
MKYIESYNIKNQTKRNRIIGKIEGAKTEPTIVFFAGIHGNEKAGVYALQKVFKQLIKEHIKGTIYGILGNLEALDKNQRYIDEDLNRLWTKSQIDVLKTAKTLNIEQIQQIELFNILKEILKTHSGALYFIDLHTTSSKTLPFITINDAIINRKFSNLFPVPIVLGIEEYLNGPLLSYINELGYVSLGFESGQHDESVSIQNSIAFINLALVFTGLIKKENSLNYSEHCNQLKKESKQNITIFEVVYLHRIQAKHHFKMLEGFKSFQNIKKGVLLAHNNSTKILSKHNGNIFMPLYQKQGNEGFFIIKPIKPFLLNLSELLRRFNADNLLVVLPGITWFNKQKGVLYVNLKVARFLAKPIFHLLGYRNKQIDATHIKMYNRERLSKIKLYKKEMWYKKAKN